jgi:hypothetical protein
MPCVDGVINWDIEHDFEKIYLDSSEECEVL